MLESFVTGWKFTFFLAQFWWEVIITNDDIYNTMPEAFWDLLNIHEN